MHNTFSVALLKIGTDNPDNELKAREEKLEPNKAAMLIFTSGTTGPPKGIPFIEQIMVLNYESTVKCVG